MGALFLFGSVMFWSLIIIASICIIVTTEKDESNSWGWFVIAVAIILLYIGGNSKSINLIFSYIAENPLRIILWFIFYIIVGIIWSFIKWYFYLIGRKEYHKNYGYSYHSTERNYNVNNNKERILNWMIYWPLSALWTIINQPIKNTFKFVFNTFAGKYQKMSDSIFKDSDKSK